MFLELCIYFMCFFFFKQKTAYEMRISDWSSDVCSSDLGAAAFHSAACATHGLCCQACFPQRLRKRTLSGQPLKKRSPAAETGSRQARRTCSRLQLQQVGRRSVAQLSGFLDDLKELAEAAGRRVMGQQLARLGALDAMGLEHGGDVFRQRFWPIDHVMGAAQQRAIGGRLHPAAQRVEQAVVAGDDQAARASLHIVDCPQLLQQVERSEEHTSELQSLMRISYAV